jgi:metallo-beta-lactamase class B
MKFILSAFLFLTSLSAYCQRKPFKISTEHLTANIYVHTSYGMPDGKTPFPANGLYVVTDNGVILIDTPWDEDQTQQLIDTIAQRYGKKIILCISTHHHGDRTAGIDVLKKHGIKTYSSLFTKQIAMQKGEKQPEFTFSKDTTFRVGNTMLQTFYPGAGHSKDNIVIWFPQSRVLFGGCFIKSLDTNDIGYTGDADIKQWPLSIVRVKTHFNNIKYIVPGHQGWKGDTLMFSHTLNILKHK